LLTTNSIFLGIILGSLKFKWIEICKHFTNPSQYSLEHIITYELVDQLIKYAPDLNEVSIQGKNKILLILNLFEKKLFKLKA
jgi:hypothetical protein